MGQNNDLLNNIPLSLFYVRKDYDNYILNESDVVKYWDAWRKQNQYIVLYREKEIIIKTLDDGNNEIKEWKVEVKAMKCSKRGNDIYFFRVKKRFEEILNFCKEKCYFIKKDNGFWGNVLYVTLTVDTKKIDNVKMAWKKISSFWNRFITAMRRRYGLIEVIRVYEATDNYYPHIHAVLLFLETRFRVIRYKNKRKKFEEWRLYDKKIKEDINKLWKLGFVDIQAINSTDKVRYVVKYITKEQQKKRDIEKQRRTLAMLWLFRKQSFSISQRFLEYLTERSERLEQYMHNSNLLNSEWQFIGIFLDYDLNLDGEKWVVIFNKIPQIVLKKMYS